MTTIVHIIHRNNCRALFFSGNIILSMVFLFSPSRAAAEFTIHPSYKLMSDDNILLLQNNPEEDTVQTAGLGLNFDNSVNFLTASIASSVERNRYSEHDRLNNTNVASDLQLELKPFLSNNFKCSNKYYETEDFDISPDSLESHPFSSLIKQKRYLNDSKASIAQELSANTSVQVDWERLSDNVGAVGEKDQLIYGLAFGMRHGYGRMNRHSSILSIKTTDYIFKSNDSNDDVRGFSLGALSVGQHWDLSRLLNFGFSVGFSKTMDSNNDSLSETKNYPVANVKLDTDSKNLKTELIYNRQPTGEGGYGELIILDEIGLNVKAIYTPFMNSTFSGKYVNYDFADENVSGKDKDSIALYFYADLKHENGGAHSISAFYSFYKKSFENPIEAGIPDFEQSTMGLKSLFFISDYFELKLEYNYAHRKTTGEPDGNSFKRNLVAATISLHI